MCTVTGGCEAKRKESVESARGKEVCQTECPGAIVCAGTIMDGGGVGMERKVEVEKEYEKEQTKENEQEDQEEEGEANRRRGWQ